MKKYGKKQKNLTANKLLAIESKDRLSSEIIDELSNKPQLLDIYLKSSIENTFSELLFRLTYEKYSEKKANRLWDAILEHRNELNKKLERDVGILTATLDYLTNITGEILCPKIIHDQRIEEAAKIATTDALTGLYSRNIFDFSIEQEIIKAIRYDKALSLMLIDIDDFKKVNDAYGHQDGDAVLRKLVKITKRILRKSDLVARYGGEEFAVIMPETSIKRAFTVAERIRKNVANILKCKELNITISIGISTLSEKINSVYDLIRIADEALYRAKRDGKNKVVKSA
jgi:diguanylate cyclase (GGDEF)-like protein